MHKKNLEDSKMLRVVPSEWCNYGYGVFLTSLYLSRKVLQACKPLKSETKYCLKFFLKPHFSSCSLSFPLRSTTPGTTSWEPRASLKYQPWVPSLGPPCPKEADWGAEATCPYQLFHIPILLDLTLLRLPLQGALWELTGGSGLPYGIGAFRGQIPGTRDGVHLSPSAQSWAWHREAT